MERVQYNEKEKNLIAKMVQEFSLVHDKNARKESLEWYSFSSSVKDVRKTEQIMKDIDAI